MLRLLIFRDPASGTELVLPVTPKEYQIEHGRKANNLTMYEAGAINLPGEKVLLDEEIECLLPAREYPFNNPGTVTNPFVYIEQLEKWSDAGTVLRYIVSNTPVNAAVILDPIRYREDDGTNDVTCVIPIRGYRQLTAETVRTAEALPSTQGTYTVKAGDTMASIARRFYGNAALYARLAAYNGIANPTLIHVGQVIKIPAVASLPAAKAKTTSQKATESTKAVYLGESMKWKVNLPKEARLLV